MYVLTQQGSNLAMTGMLTNIMPGSSLSTARFAGDLLYLTAFGSADDSTPLVVVDLSDPSAPSLAGVLNDMASTEFLQPIDATHLVGIGQLPGATDTSSDQLELSLYDVSDPTDPSLVSRTIIDDGSQGDAYSAAEYDPHALSLLPRGRHSRRSRHPHDLHEHRLLRRRSSRALRPWRPDHGGPLVPVTSPSSRPWTSSRSTPPVA